VSLKRKANSGGNGEEFEKPAAGTFPAICVAIIVTGTHNEAYPGQEARDTPKLFLVWELLGEVMAGSKFNFVIGREYTDSLNAKANLRKLIDGWRSKGPLADDEEFDISLLKGQPCLVTVTHTTPNSEGKQYANVSSVTKPMKGQKFDKPMREMFVYEAVDANPPAQDWLPRIYGKTVAERIMVSNEYVALSGTQKRVDALKNGNGQHAEQSAPQEEFTQF
jgi:hypothetical protein